MSRSKPTIASHARLTLEQLETREVPATFTVNSGADLNDSNPGDGIAWTGNMILDPVTARMQQEVTLRAAIQEANALGAQGHTINFAPFNAQGTSTVVLTQPMDDIRVPLAITGTGKTLTTITRDTTAGGGFPYFSIATGAGAQTDISVSISHMTIRDAQGALAGAGSLGGAINNAATLTLSNVDLRNNSANKGGAIYNATTGVLSLTNCILANNQVAGGGNEGGAIFATGNSQTTISNSSLEFNTSTGKGGAISFNAQSRLSLFDTDLTSNTAAEGGAVYASVGNAAGTPFTMSGGSLSSNIATGYGGALFLSSTNTRIDGTTFTNNGALKGGAIYTKTNVLELLNCIFLGNTASAYGPILAYTGTLGSTTFITQTNCFGIAPEDYVFDPTP